MWPSEYNRYSQRVLGSVIHDFLSLSYLFFFALRMLELAIVTGCAKSQIEPHVRNLRCALLFWIRLLSSRSVTSAHSSSLVPSLEDWLDNKVGELELFEKSPRLSFAPLDATVFMLLPGPAILADHFRVCLAEQDEDIGVVGICLLRRPIG